MNATETVDLNQASSAAVTDKPVYVTVSSKGQVVIPAAIRHELGIEPGTRLVMRVQGGRVIVDAESIEAKLRKIEAMHGITAGGPSGTNLLLEDRRKERERELQQESW